MLVQRTFPTNLGWMALALGQQGLIRLVFDHTTEQAARRRLSRDLARWPDAGAECVAPATNQLEGQLDRTVELLQRFADGEMVPLDSIPVDWRELTPFQVRVLRACRRIPWGETRTYADLARSVGSPTAARAVGGVMARNRLPLVIPCHRVLSSGGALGGFSSPSGLAMKQRLLQLEQADALVASER